MRLRSRSPLMRGQELRANIVLPPKSAEHVPMLVAGDLTLSLAAALANYEVIEATAEERELLQRWGHPSGGVQ